MFHVMAYLSSIPTNSTIRRSPKNDGLRRADIQPRPPASLSRSIQHDFGLSEKALPTIDRIVPFGASPTSVVDNSMPLRMTTVMAVSEGSNHRLSC